MKAYEALRFTVAVAGVTAAEVAVCVTVTLTVVVVDWPSAFVIVQVKV